MKEDLEKCNRIVYIDCSSDCSGDISTEIESPVEKNTSLSDADVSIEFG